MLVAGTFILLRKIERWLHQHIFKVGWLLTHNYQTTTILYYAFFLPGVLLHEITYWLVAGALNVSAEGSLKWPEPQEVGELKLNFVRISPRAGIYRRAFISAAPLIVALLIIWVVANNVFDLGTVLEIMARGNLDDVAEGLRHLTSAPDFWLWVYVLFTISNTMYPQIPKDLQGWRTIAGAVGIIAIILLLVGIGQTAFQLISVPVSEFLVVLQGILIFMIGINLLMTLFLGIVESIIERVTGHSATFKRGKMITMTRAEAVALQERERERQRKQQALATTGRRSPTPETAISSVYALMLPVPGGPEEEVIAAPVFKIEPESPPALPERPAVSPRLGAEMITVGGRPLNAPETPPAPALPEGIKPKRQTKTNPAVSAEPPPTPAFPAAKAPSADQVEEAVQMLRTPVAKPPTPPTPAQVDDAVETFRSTTSDAAKTPPIPPPAAPVGSEKPASPRQGLDLDDLPAPTVKPYAPFERPPSPFAASTTNDDDEDDLASFRTPPAAAKPASTPFRPASPFGPATTPQPDEDEDDLASFRTPPAAAKPTNTPFRPTSPFGPATTPQPDDDEDDLASFRPPPAAAKPTSTPFRPASPFGPSATSRPDDDEDDLASFHTPPAAAKPASTPFRPASPFGPATTPQPDDDEDNLASFRTPPAAAKPASTPFRPASPFGPATGDAKPPATPPTRGFTPAPRSGPPPTSPFGAKPAMPPRRDEDESLSNRVTKDAQDATDDLFSDLTPPTKRTTGMQPVVRAGGFGTSRPVPKKPLGSSSRDDDDDDMEDLRYEDEDPRYSDDEDSTSGDDD